MPEEPDRGSMFAGVALALASNVLMAALLLYLAVTGMALPLVGFALTQVLWLGPLWGYFRSRGEPETAKGVLIVFGVTFLLSAACYGVFYRILSNAYSPK